MPKTANEEKISPSKYLDYTVPSCVLSTSKKLWYCYCLRNSEPFKTVFKTSQPPKKTKMAKINSETLLKRDYLLLQKRQH